MMAEDDELEDVSSTTRKPPYVSFKTLLSILQDLKDNGLPPQIDRSILKRFSGTVGAQALAAMKYLGLVDERNQSTDRLREMVTAFGTDKFPPLLKRVIVSS